MAEDALTIHPYDFDDGLIAKAIAGRPAFALYRPEKPMVVLGRGSKVALEVDEAALAHEAIDLYRRKGGGCTVLLDPGNVVISVAMPLAGFGGNKKHIEALSDWLIEGLTRLGIKNLRREGISDIVQGEKKISGSCVHRSKDVFYFSASLLVNADLARLARCLKHPPREPDYRAGRDHRGFVANLDLANRHELQDVEHFMMRLNESLAEKGFPNLD